MAAIRHTRAHAAEGTASEVLNRLCDEENSSRISSAINRRIHDAKFPEINTIDRSAFEFDGSRKKMRSRYVALQI